MKRYTSKETRRKLIEVLYREILGREGDEEGIKAYYSSSASIEQIYEVFYESDEHLELKRKEEKAAHILPITLAIFAKDSEDCIERAITSMKEHVAEVVVVDTGSSDSTVEIAHRFTDRVYKVGFTDFGNIRTLTSHLARQPWVLGLDTDEIILPEDVPILRKLIDEKDVSVWNLPRKRWLDLEMTKQVELEAYPDWQPRLYKNEVNIVWTRRVHERLEGEYRGRKDAVDGPHIHHFQDVYKKGDALRDRNLFYKKLYQMDIDEGIQHEEPPVASLDEHEIN